MIIQKAIWVGSSNYKEKVEEVKENHKKFQEMISNGYKIIEVKRKRPRIISNPKPKKVAISLFGITKTITWEEYNTHCTGIKIIKRIY